MAARFDKYDGKVGGFRVPLAVATAKNTGLPIAYGVNSAGRAVPGAGQTGIRGLVVFTKDMNAGQIADVMTSGEIVDCVGLTAGTTYTANTTTGIITNAAASATQVPVGFTVEATRLVVRTSTPLFIGT